MEQCITEIARNIAKYINTSSKIVIFSHINPDGDAIGSALGLYHYLKKTTGDVFVIMPNGFPDFLNFLPASGQIVLFDKETEKAGGLIASADMIFYLDFNDPKRIEKMGKLASHVKAVKVMIDHHPDPVEFADYSLSDTSVCSTAELVFEFIHAMGAKLLIEKEAADCLLTGIITDTGMFNHNSERRRTFEIVADLLDMGADKQKIIQEVYNNYPFNRMQLLGNALHNRFCFYPEYGAAFIYLPKDDLEKYKHQVGDTEGFVNMALSVAGVKVSAIFLEKDDHIKCSFRSTGNFDVNVLAKKYFNGGGHKNASGGKSFQPLNKTKEQFVQLLEKYKYEILASY
jgi:bifunctional oligoribonuclease and PAP phosphatase NrnA